MGPRTATQAASVSREVEEGGRGFGACGSPLISWRSVAVSRPSPDAAVWLAPSPCASRLSAQGHPTAQPLLAQHHRRQGVAQAVKASAYNDEDPGSIPGLGRSPGEGNGNPLQYSCLENPMDRGAW